MNTERTTSLDLEARAYRAYERGRWWLGVRSAWPALVLAGVCIALGGRPLITVLVGVLLASTIVAAVHHGRSAGRAVVLGLAGGSLPLFAGLAACRVPHVCGGPGCLDFCAPLCLGAGAVAGLFMVVRGRRASGSNAPALGVATTIALLTGALGCFLVGLGGIVGMAVGLAAGASLGLIPRPSRA